MWAVTGWAVATWLELTVLLALGVGAAWLWLDRAAAPPEARSSWWWSP